MTIIYIINSLSLLKMDYDGYINGIIENDGNILLIIGKLKNDLIYILKERGQIIVKIRKLNTKYFKEIIYYPSFVETLDKNEVVSFRIKQCLKENIHLEIIRLELDFHSQVHVTC